MTDDYGIPDSYLRAKHIPVCYLPSRLGIKLCRLRINPKKLKKRGQKAEIGSRASRAKPAVIPYRRKLSNTAVVLTEKIIKQKVLGPTQSAHDKPDSPVSDIHHCFLIGPLNKGSQIKAIRLLKTNCLRSVAAKFLQRLLRRAFGPNPRLVVWRTSNKRER